MKKLKSFISLCLLSAMVFSLTACSQGRKSENTLDKAVSSSIDNNSYDAKAINSAIKGYYAAIKSGNVNKENKSNFLSNYNLPEKDATSDIRIDYANNTATVKEAMEWDGLWEHLYLKVQGGNFGYIDGNIIDAVDKYGNKIYQTQNGIAITVISDSTTLGEIFEYSTSSSW